MEVAESGSIGCLNAVGVLWPYAVDEEVISQRAWGALHGFDHQSPRMKKESHHGHAKTAALGDAAGVEMWLAKASTHSVVEMQEEWKSA